MDVVINLPENHISFPFPFFPSFPFVGGEGEQGPGVGRGGPPLKSGDRSESPT